MFGSTTLLTLTLLISRSYGAQTALYFPGFDPQSLSVDFISTDSQGHTAWAVHGVGTDSIPGVMTLVEGSNYASEAYTYDTLTLNGACSLTSGTATCTNTVNGVVTTAQEVVTFITVDLGTAGPSTTAASPSATSTTSSSSSSSAGTGNTGTSSVSATPKTTTSVASSTSTATKSNAAQTTTLMGGNGSVCLFLAVIFSLLSTL